MKTTDLIAALAADGATPATPIRRRMLLAIALGALISLVLFAMMFGPRPDAMGAMHSMRFDMKFVETLAWATPSFLLCLRLARPEARPNAVFALLLLPIALLVAGLGMELAMVPRDLWMTKMIGRNWYHCLSIIPLLSIAPLAALILALREGAPGYPGLTGALAGAASAGAAATFYASNCTDDSPLFVVTWYPLATAIVVAVGFLAGRRWLKW